MKKSKAITTVKRPLVYTSFDGDLIELRQDMCKLVLQQGGIPINPENALGYYVSTVSCGNQKPKVMAHCLTLAMLADEMWVFGDPKDSLAEGVVAEIILWSEVKNKGVKFVHGVNTLTEIGQQHTVDMTGGQVKQWIAAQGIGFIEEIKRKCLNPYKQSKPKTAYLIFDSKKQKRVDFARAFCYKNELCPLSPRDILPEYLYDFLGLGDRKLADRLTLLGKADQILWLYETLDEIENLDKTSQGELDFAMQQRNKAIEILGWSEVGVSKQVEDRVIDG